MSCAEAHCLKKILKKQIPTKVHVIPVFFLGAKRNGAIGAADLGWAPLSQSLLDPVGKCMHTVKCDLLQKFRVLHLPGGIKCGGGCTMGDGLCVLVC